MANFSSTQVMKKFLEEDSPVKPGSSLIVAGQSGDLKASATDLLAVKKTLPEGNIEYAASVLRASPRPPGPTMRSPRRWPSIPHDYDEKKPLAIGVLLAAYIKLNSWYAGRGIS